MGKNFTNKEIAELLRQVAAAYIVNDENKYKFQIVAYQRAADSIEHSSSEVKDLYDEGKLTGLAGIGPSIASHLEELFLKGKVKHFEELFSKLPSSMFKLLDIPGIGAKTAFKLTKLLKINNPDKAIKLLSEAAQKGKIRVIPGFGEESEAKILKSIKEISTRPERILLFKAWQIAQEVVNYLSQSPSVVRADPLGSLRRRCSTVGDIDIAVASTDPRKVIKFFTGFHKAKRVLEAGEATASLILSSNMQVDLMVQSPDSYGALLQHFTGSKHHNIKLREVALKKGLSLSEYGVRPIKKGEKLEVGSERNVRPKGKLIKFSTEEEFYHKLGMEWIPPELREDSGEIEAATRYAQGGKNGLPKLVEASDIKGDLHLHSDFLIEPSHDLGESSFEEMMNKAISLGYKYLAFTEHNPSISKHSQRQIIDLLRRKKKYIEHLNTPGVNKLPIRVFNSLEVDIKPSGELAISEEGMKYLDFAIVSIHSNFNLDKETMTKRVLRAMDHPKVKIFGHPTGRILEKREGIELDWGKIFNFCLKFHKYLEVSAYPDRLDLPDFLVREAVRRGIKVVINTDSHSVNQMSFMEYGVSVTRRGWAEKKDILNCLPENEISAILLNC